MARLKMDLLTTDGGTTTFFCDDAALLCVPGTLAPELAVAGGLKAGDKFCRFRGCRTLGCQDLVELAADPEEIV